MKLFLDSASLDEIRQAALTGLIDGVTTNPSLVAKEEGAFDLLIHEICQIIKGPVSAEVTENSYQGMLQQGQHLARIAKNVVVKVPLTPDGLRVCSALRQDGIEVNVTLCFSVCQAYLAAKAGATFVSPFLGRLDDIGGDSIDMIESIHQIYQQHDYETQILAASIRHVEHVQSAVLAGADALTLPFAIFNKLFDHPLTEQGVNLFMKDWKKSGK